ncbi:hypothetical protein GM31_03405 [Trabulsiella odontotermitis]|uniref:Uncharacterized protein n=1 Tax=Trabulsiella odontotermitis TaxID=379893 RepID=A0A0L0GNT1_9ENTR|nr:hypothetical protein GM31_03405 [Trabulsiella odontotermitis]
MLSEKTVVFIIVMIQRIWLMEELILVKLMLIVLFPKEKKWTLMVMVTSNQDLRLRVQEGVE